MDHDAQSRVFAAATDAETLSELKQLDLHILEDGNIGGLNGILLGVAAETRAAGRMSPGRNAAHLRPAAVPESVAGGARRRSRPSRKIEIDFTELSEQASEMDQKLGELLAQMQASDAAGAARPRKSPKRLSEDIRPEAAEDERISSDDRERIERLFEQAKHDRSTAYELKRELDRLEVYREYEDRFLDLFKKPQ